MKMGKLITTILLGLMAVAFMGASCDEIPIIAIVQPEEGQNFTVDTVAVSIDYENGDTGTFLASLNGNDITSLFAIGETQATATLTGLANGSYELAAQISNDDGTSEDSVQFTVTVPAVPSTIDIVSGNDQSDVVGAILAADLVVEVLDQWGGSFANIQVNFAVLSGGGSVNPPSDLTGPDGKASTALTLPTVPGPVQVEAEVSGYPALSVVFDATALTGPAQGIAIHSGNNQIGMVNETLPDPLVVLVTDAYGNPVEGEPVGFAAITGGGSVDPASAATDASGLAGTTLTLGPNPGTNEVEATVATKASVIFTANATFLPVPDSIVLNDPPTVNADDGQFTAQAGVFDQYGFPMAGATVSFALSPDLGGVVGTVIDNGDGTYSCMISNLRKALTGTLTASVDGLIDTKALTVVHGAVDDVALDAPATVSADIGLVNTLTTVGDQWGNPIATAAVTVVSAPQGTAGSVINNGNGTYSCTVTGLTDATADATITASADGISDDALVDVTPGAVAQVDVTVAPDVFDADLGTTEATATVTDQYGNPINSATVAWTTGLGSITGETNNGDGTYSATVIDAHTAGGPYTVTSQADSLTGSDTFTVTPGAPASVDVVVDPDLVPANPGDTHATAAVNDAYANPITDAVVGFGSGSGTPGAPVNNGDWTYTSHITGICGLGTFTVTATAGSASGSDTFEGVPGDPAALDLTLSAYEIERGDSVDYAILLTDGCSNGLAGLAPGLATCDPDVTFTGPADAGAGNYTGTVTTGYAYIGTCAITASLGALEDTENLEITTGCNTEPDPNGGTNGCPIDGSIEVVVIDDETKDPIAGAFVQVGPEPDVPFAGNSGSTDAGGRIFFADPALSGAISVTAGVPGSVLYSFMSIAEVDANRIVMPLKHQTRRAVATSSISGDVGDFDINNNDGNLDAGIVIPSFTIDMLLSLDIESLLAAEVPRSLPIVGDVMVPGNVYAPSQWEYLFFNIDLTPYMGIQVETYTFQDMYCLAGRVPIADVIELLQGGGEYSELIELLEIRKAGITRNHYITGNADIDFPLSNGVNLDLTVNVDNTPADSAVYIVSIADMDAMNGSGKLVPMGFNIADGGAPASVSLTTVSKSGTFAGYSLIAAAVVASELDQGLTTAIQRTGLDYDATAVLDSFFAILSNLNQTGAILEFDDPETASSPAMDLQFSSIYLEDVTNETTAYQWDVMADASLFELPDLALAAEDYPLTDPSGTPEYDYLYWEAAAYGLTLSTDFNFNHFAFDEIESDLTHFSFNSMSIGFPN